MCIWSISSVLLNDTATPDIYTYLHTLPLPDSPPISYPALSHPGRSAVQRDYPRRRIAVEQVVDRPHQAMQQIALRPCAGEDPDAEQHAQQQPGKVIGGLRHGDGAIALAAFGTAAEKGLDQIGRASCRERVCQYV